MQVDLSGRLALVTGASSGFGRHFARLLARSGAEVVAAARRTDRLESLVAEIVAEGGRARPLALDVTDVRAVRTAVQALPPLDIVINNAGIGTGDRAIDIEPEAWDATFAANLRGAFFVAQAAARGLIAAGRGGSIINIASITGLRPGPTVAAYGASKAGLIHLTRSLAMEWARHGIRVNALAPGYIETDLNREFLASDFAQAMLKRVPQRRFGDMRDLDGPLLLLASDASAHMTGVVLPVDGGHTVSVL
ncbi:MAG: SDR family oxidoreductase [Alphaproteobacteria bacterium]|nr:SDR family oxidoreductase [Alphaproteobacteria bacterium]